MGTYFFLRSNYAELTWKRRERKDVGVRAPCCFTAQRAVLFSSSPSRDPLPVCSSQRGRQRRKESTCVSLRLSGARREREKPACVPGPVGRDGAFFPGLQNTSVDNKYSAVAILGGSRELAVVLDFFLTVFSSVACLPQWTGMNLMTSVNL